MLGARRRRISVKRERSQRLVATVGNDTFLRPPLHDQVLFQQIVRGSLGYVFAPRSVDPTDRCKGF